MPNLEDINEIKIELDFNDIIESTCKELVNDIRQNAVREFGNGDYSKNWTFKLKKNKDGKNEGVVYNDKTYRLTHLLEFGHVKANQYKSNNGRVAPKPHIKPAYDKEKQKFIKDMSACRYIVKTK